MAVLLHISPNQFPGLEKSHFTKKIWLELSKGFDEYHILARSYDNKFHTSIEGNITLHLIPQISKRSAIFFFSSFYIFILIKKIKATHLLAQSSILGGFTAALASKFYKIPLMTEIHGEEYFNFLQKNSLKKRLLSLIISFSFKQSSVIRSLNDKMTEKLNAAGFNNNIVVIPNRVDLSLFNRQKSNFKSDQPIKIVSVGRFVKEKNYLQLINNLGETGLNFDLTLIGGGSLKQLYLDAINTKALKGKVTLIDWVSQDALVDLIIQSDLYIQYSISEGMPRTILEAMALGMPIVTTDVGSIAGVVKNGHNGLVLRDFSVEVLCEAIEQIKSTDFARFLASNAYDDVYHKYEWNAVFDLYRRSVTSMSRKA